MTARKARELPGLVRERRAVIDFLLSWRSVDEKTTRRRMYQHPRAPAAPRRVVDLERLSFSWSELEQFEVPLWDPVHHARDAIVATMRERPNDLRQNTKLYRAIEDLRHALVVHTSDVDRRTIAWSIVRLRELTGWTEDD